MSKQCLQCGFPLEDKDLPLCPSCNLKTMQKIEFERRLSDNKKSLSLVGIVLWCVLGVIIFFAGAFLFNYAQKSWRTEKLGLVLQDIKSDMHAHNYAEAWGALQKAKALDPSDEAVVKLTAALLKEPLEVANSLIAQGQFEEARKILADVKTFDASAALTLALKRCDYEQCMTFARREAANWVQTNKYGGLHCWKEAAKDYEKAIAASDTPEARQGLKSAQEMLKVEEDALLTRLRNEVNSALQGSSTNIMSQHVVNISALKDSLSQGDKVDGFLEELKNGMANAEKIAGLELALNKAKLGNRNEEAIGNIQEILKLLPVQSGKYTQYTNEVKRLSHSSVQSAKEQATAKEQAAAIEAKKCVWRITPSPNEAMSDDGLIRFTVISVAPGYEATKNIGNLCANIRSPILNNGGAYRQNMNRLDSEKDYLENVLNNNRELVTAEVDVCNAGKSALTLDRASIKFVDQSDNNYDCANLVDLGANSNNSVTLEPGLKKKLYALFVVPHDIMPKGMRLFAILNRYELRNAEAKKEEVFSAFDNVEVNGHTIASSGDGIFKKEESATAGANDSFIASLKKDDHLHINLKGPDPKAYVGKVLQISKTQIMLQQEGENVNVVSVPIDNIAEIKKD